MYKTTLFFFLHFVMITRLAAQDNEMIPDTVKKELAGVTIHAFGQNRPLQHIPASVGYIGNDRLNGYGNANILLAVNTIPGARMEERSPGSYRLSIRGSSLRSPFGVRNIKIYYNDIPLTDPGGHTYLNQLGFYNFQSITILKGTGSSMYGAGTGGVMLIGSLPDEFGQGASIAYTAGSYNMHHVLAEARFGNDRSRNAIRYQRLQNDGYREQSAMQREVISWDAGYTADEKNQLSAHFLYGDLYYQTPGALNLKEFETDPRMARPHVGAVLGAAEAGAAIYEKTFLAGFSLKHDFTKRLQLNTTAYGAYTQLKNPTLRNYERKTEPHFGGRASFSYRFSIGNTALDWITGGEFQQGFASLRVYGTNYGAPDSMQSDDEMHTRQYFGFTQLGWQAGKLVITLGFSVNRQHVSFIRLSNPPATEYLRDFDNGITPRLAAIYELQGGFSIYGSAAKGFSPPTKDELTPSGGSVNVSLNAEQGWNYELGLRGSLLHDRLSFDLNLFYFRLDNTIVQRRDSAGGDYYINAGGTKQPGIEAYLNYRFPSRAESFMKASIRAGYSRSDFSYADFTQLDQDYTGNKMPGVAANTLSAGADLNIRPGLYANLSYYYNDKITLNDANTAFADPYHLIGARIGFKKAFFRRYVIDLFAGADNLMGKLYSLGNDINGFGGRYYNVAAGRNFYGGLRLDINGRKDPAQ